MKRILLAALLGLLCWGFLAPAAPAPWPRNRGQGRNRHPWPVGEWKNEDRGYRLRLMPAGGVEEVWEGKILPLGGTWLKIDDDRIEITWRRPRGWAVIYRLERDEDRPERLWVFPTGGWGFFGSLEPIR